MLLKLVKPIAAAAVTIGPAVAYFTSDRLQDPVANTVSSKEPCDAQGPYDYIVVGAGSSGCVLANRLSKDPSQSVLIIEAGPQDAEMLVHMPAGYSKLVTKKGNFNYQLQTQPQVGLNNRADVWPRGKGWGGSSNINAMVYTRGHAWDYDHWASLGNKGWGYCDILPYFKRAETYSAGGNDYHGSTGPLSVIKSTRTDDPLMDLFIAAGHQAGHPLTDDFNGVSQEGFSRYEHTVFPFHQRCSAARAYLYPALARSNCDIVDNSRVKKIVFDKKRAVGVEYQHGKETITVMAKKEIILSCGAVHSPQVLMLSGIGDPEDLQRYGIPVVHNLPGVGKNLQDHISVHVTFESTDREITLHRSNTLFRRIMTGIKYLYNRTGSASFPPTSAGAFFKALPESLIPDTQLHYISVNFHTLSENHPKAGKRREAAGFSALINLCRPHSKGFITLSSANPFDPPFIQPNSFSDPRDLDELMIATKRTLDVLKQNALNNYRGKQVDPPPGLTDKRLKQWIRNTAATVYHPISTCKMGNDAMAVVDDTLKVKGLESLRVVDASIMPTLIAGNTNAPSIMIAEKASDMILGRAPLSPANSNINPCYEI